MEKKLKLYSKRSFKSLLFLLLIIFILYINYLLDLYQIVDTALIEKLNVVFSIFALITWILNCYYSIRTIIANESVSFSLILGIYGSMFFFVLFSGVMIYEFTGELLYTSELLVSVMVMLM